MINRQWRLASRPQGAVNRSNFDYAETQVLASPDTGGKVLLRTEMLLCMPTIRNFISGKRSDYYPTIELGEPIMSPGVGRVVESSDSDYPVGTRLVGGSSWQDYQWVDPEQGYRVVPNDTPSVDALGILGMNALTAYFGVVEVGQPQSGETLLVSGAAGSVGSIAAQIGRIRGARVIGICGGSEKVNWLKDSCGIAEVIDYKAQDVGVALDALCPDGVDVFFDNIGGTMLRDIVQRMRRHGRIALCGQIATYDDAADNPPLDMMRIIYGAIRLQGFLVPDFADQMPQALERLSEWDRQGLLAHREDVRAGFEALPDTFASLFNGSNNGTLIARIADEESRPI
ncbi:NADP-dependent oxidoreductase [Altericroceibacterium xinjiangense]|uniref:NADP-dependent oxidoreductase n=1 Tax=Altericroceibacterium xinjiangense TaxID=762261 RepID=UPI000F7D8AB0|nr:NADP-dependent oxidoreductase [Altericroceibacterium xinjiangense]